MGRPGVLSLVELDVDELRRLEALADVEVRPWTETLELVDPDELNAELNAKRVLGLFVEADFVVAETFAAVPALGFVGICRGDPGHVDIQAATRAGVVVTHTPGRNAEAVAELTIAMMLALLRDVPRAAAYVAERRWQDPVTAYVDMRGSELGRQVVGIIGLGRIGCETARLAGAFGARVLATDPALNDEQIRAAGCEPRFVSRPAGGLHDAGGALPIAGVHEGNDRRPGAGPDAAGREAGGDHGRRGGTGGRCCRVTALRAPGRGRV